MSSPVRRGSLKFDSHRVASVQRPCNTDQHLGEIGIDAPVVGLVGIGQSRARHSTAEAHMVQFAAHRAQARFDIAQAFTISQLSESHGQVLVPARETPPVTIAAITGYALLKVVGGQVVHELNEYSLVGVHPSLSAISPGLRCGSFARRSARKIQIEKTAIPPKLLIMKRLHGSAKI